MPEPHGTSTPVSTTPVDSPPAFFDRELSWLAFARRVLALVEDRDLPLFERIKFAGIMGMLHDEFFMKRMSGIKRKMRKRPDKRSLDGRTAAQELVACRAEVVARYAEHTGFDMSRVDYYLALAYFRITVIIQQIYVRWVRGQTRDDRFAALGDLVPLLARAGVEAAARS